jgi:hypothetical protein
MECQTWLPWWPKERCAKPTAVRESAYDNAVLGVYNYKAETIRKGAAHDALRGELIRFVSAAELYDKDEKTNVTLFESPIRSIIQSELQVWRSAFTDSSDS